MFTAASSWTDLLDFAWIRIVALDSSFTSFEQCPEHVYGRSLAFKTVGDAFDKVITPNADGWSAGITLWMGLHVWDALDADLRNRIVSALARHDPARSAILYRQQPGLTDDHDQTLWAAFSVCMPFTTRKLSLSGVRAKAVSGG